MVPFIPGWNLHMYVKVPTVSKVRLKVAPGESVPLSKVPSVIPPWVEETVCGAESLLVQVTLAPFLILTELGPKAKPLIFTEAFTMGVGVEIGFGVGDDGLGAGIGSMGSGATVGMGLGSGLGVSGGVGVGA